MWGNSRGRRACEEADAIVQVSNASGVQLLIWGTGEERERGGMRKVGK